ncbi:MAG: hypothetical protein IJB49_04465 [Clostridia bacterium]|nr:hypothetical protein [Clostridia bacterium]
MNISIEKITRIIKKNLLIILAVALLFFGGAFAYMKLLVAPRYFTTAEFYAKDTSIDTSTSQGLNATRAQADTFIIMLETDNFFKSVYEALPDDVKEKTTWQSLKTSSSFGKIGETEVIQVSFVSTDESIVIPVTNTILACVQPHLDVTFGDCSCHIVDSPSDYSVSSNRTTIVCLVATVIGALLVLAVLVIRDMLDVRIRSAAVLVQRYNVPILGIIPEFDPEKIKKKEAAEDGKEQ